MHCCDCWTQVWTSIHAHGMLRQIFIYCGVVSKMLMWDGFIVNSVWAVNRQARRRREQHLSAPPPLFFSTSLPNLYCLLSGLPGPYTIFSLVLGPCTNMSMEQNLTIATHLNDTIFMCSRSSDYNPHLTEDYCTLA